MKKFLKYSLLFILPLILYLVEYVICDPFKVIRHYDNYYLEKGSGSVNRNFVSTMNYLNKNDLYHYDSFIFGNSRSLFYMIEDWKDHIDSNSICYHFSESGGSINGLYYKVRLIDENGGKLNNALFVIDRDLLANLEQDGRLFIMPPVLNYNKNIVQFHKEHLLAWFDFKFWLLWTEYRITGVYRQEMNDYLAIGTNYKYYNPITNEEPRIVQDSLISIGEYYNEERIAEFETAQQFSDSISPPYLNDIKIKSLMEMHSILERQHTKYRIIISPMYNQIKLNPSDYQILCMVFGKDNVFDFSGVSKWSGDYHNYYETSHYLPNVAAQVMDSVYSNN